MHSKHQLAHGFMLAHPLDAARVLDQQNIDDLIILLQATPSETAAETLRQMDDNVVTIILDRMETGKASEIMACFPIRTASVLLRRMATRETMLSRLQDDLATDLQRVIQYPEGTAGALMELKIFTVSQDVKIGEVLKTVRQHPEYIKDYLYVVTRDHLLVGVCSLNRMLSASLDQNVAAIMHAPQYPLSPYMTQEAILDHPGWKQFHDLPVVDVDGVFLGVISYKEMRRLEGNQMTRIDQDTGTALGELYWLGLSAFVKGAGSVGKKNEQSK